MRKGVCILAAMLLMAGCGPKAITVGSRPFPAGSPVFSDASGKTLAALPDADGTVRFVFLEFPWCPPCADVWRAMRTAAAPFPPGTVRIYRILFDRETVLSSSGRKTGPPLNPVPLPDGDVPEDPGSIMVTTLTALPDAFHKEFRLSIGPMVLLLGAEGEVERRWNGFSVGMARELSSEITKRSSALSPRPPGT